MNLIQQFPDASIQIRAKIKLSKKNNTQNILDLLPYETSREVIKYYENEFRKWHYKLVFVLLTCFASIYFMIANVVGLFEWMSIRL